MYLCSIILLTFDVPAHTFAHIKIYLEILICLSRVVICAEKQRKVVTGWASHLLMTHLVLNQLSLSLSVCVRVCARALFFFFLISICGYMSLWYSCH